MKTLVRVVLAIVVVLIVVAGAGVAYLFARYPDVPPPESVTVVATPEKIARGEYLAKHVTQCVGCHADRDFTKYAGPVLDGTEGRGGENFGSPGNAVRTLYSRNITPAAIGQWTDGELIRAVTAGVSKDGEPLFPIMPYPRYAQMSRADVEAIVAYVRTLAPVEYTAPSRDLAMPLPLVVRTIPKVPAFRPIPPRTDRVAYGEYLTNAASCGECHTPMDAQGPPLPGMDFAGGFEFPLPGGGLGAKLQHHAGCRHWDRHVERAAVHRQVQGLRRRSHPLARTRRAAREHGDAVARLRQDDEGGPWRRLQLPAHAQARHQSRAEAPAPALTRAD
jgi:mono/diheme cytochrome c family protein